MAERQDLPNLCAECGKKMNHVPERQTYVPTPCPSCLGELLHFVTMEFIANDTAVRWFFICQECCNHVNHVCGFSSDGETMDMTSTSTPCPKTDVQVSHWINIHSKEHMITTATTCSCSRRRHFTREEVVRCDICNDSSEKCQIPGMKNMHMLK